MSGRIEFWIDVGGTFTDCLMKSSDGTLTTFKVLSSGITKGDVSRFIDDTTFVDRGRIGDVDSFWSGYELTFLDSNGTESCLARVASFDGRTGTFTIDRSVDCLHKTNTDDAISPTASRNYELRSPEEAPILAIRLALGLRLDQPIPPVDVRLGTTRGTNALLTRTGAKTGFVTTKGFRDILLIANQDRPRLFDLNIKKPEPLFSAVAEIEERIDAKGNAIVVPKETEIHDELMKLKQSGCESLAICLLHSFTNPDHERIVERVARGIGFQQISTSSRLAPLIKIVSRGDTTVVDAYISPVLRDYVLHLHASLGESSNEMKVTSDENRIGAPNATPPFTSSLPLVTFNSSLVTSSLKLMMSAGGLVDADRFSGKDSLLSGPAGGVVGFSRVAQQAGFSQSIGFDMGGTSTDVSRFDGQYEREFETTKAGVRIVTPMLAIETVAAGGGSLCGFDGVKLFVGPQSAGANPGPACYGRGGPLTITDMNFYLGKIIPDQFPFSLDRNTVEVKLNEMCDRVATSPLGQRYTPHELAQGFIDIANTTMARAIRKISVSKGYDPARYVLVTFGGAGAQHACAIANSLGMTSILSHPYSGVLSAFGIGQADVREIREQSILKLYSTELLDELKSDFEALAESARQSVLNEGIRFDQIDPPIRSLELRYRGIEASLTIVESTDRDFQSSYVKRHQELYGYVRSNCPIEVVAARVEVVGRRRLEDPVLTNSSIVVDGRPELESSLSHPTLKMGGSLGLENSSYKKSIEQIQQTGMSNRPPTTVEVWFQNRPWQTSIYLRNDLKPGDSFPGPAIVCEPTSTVVVDPGFVATILRQGEIVITNNEASKEFATILNCGAVTNEMIQNNPSTKFSSPFARWEESGRGDDGPQEFEFLKVPPLKPPHRDEGNRDSVAERFSQPVSDSKSTADPPSSHPDPIKIEIFNHLFASIAEQMGIALQQTSLSTNVKERLDFSCGIFSATGDLIVNAPHIPVHLGAMSETVRRIIANNSNIERGDVFVTNDPYRGGSHLPDVTVVTPVHDRESSQLLFFTASRAHHAEIGGIVPGSMPPFSKTLADEGVLIRNFRLLHQGESNEPQLRSLLSSGPFPSRAINDNIADIWAQVAANQTGANQLHLLVQTHSWPTVQMLMQQIQASAAAKMRLAINELMSTRDLIQQNFMKSTSFPSPQWGGRGVGTIPESSSDSSISLVPGPPHQVEGDVVSTSGSGITANSKVSAVFGHEQKPSSPVHRYTCTDHLDDGTPICVTITLHDGCAHVDFTGTGPVLASNLNANRAIVTAAVLYVFRCLIEDDIPLNSGVLEPVTIELPESLLNPPSHDDPNQCAAIVGGNVETSQRVVDVLLGALGIAAASQGTMNNLTFGDGTFGYYETICGGSGATTKAHGADAVHTHMTNTRLTDPEIFERRYPVRLVEFSIREHSGGSGKHHGGEGVLRKFEFLKSLNVSILSERRGPFAPFGLQGGKPGQLGRNQLERKNPDGSITSLDLGGKISIEVQPGDILTIETPGGGGFGDGGEI